MSRDANLDMNQGQGVRPGTAPPFSMFEPSASVSDESGQAGASARRQYERRRDRRESRIRAAHPHFAGLLLRLAPEPQKISAWATGAEGEELLATVGLGGRLHH